MPEWEYSVGALHVERMIHGFRQGLRDLVPIWQIVLDPADTFQQILELGIDDRGQFSVSFTASGFKSSMTWRLAYHDRLLHRESIC